jgi:diguanylate cyclase (GGDEF)-like protein/PAS domain S-box-containing protein
MFPEVEAMIPSEEHDRNGSSRLNALKPDSPRPFFRRALNALLWAVVFACPVYAAFYRLSSEAAFLALTFLYFALAAAIVLWQKARKRLAASDAVTSVLTDTMGGYCWEWNLAGGRFSLTPDGSLLFGKSISTFGDFLTLVHPDDAAALKRSAEDFYAAGGGAFRGESFSAEFRIQSVLGRWRWFAVRSGSAKFSGDRPVRAAGGLLDVDEYCQAKEAFRKSEKRLSVIFQNAPGAMAVTDNSGNIIDANQAFCDILGRSEVELRGIPIMSFSAASHEGEGRALMENLRLKLERREDRHFHTEEEFVRRDGTRVAVNYALSTILDHDGNIAHYIFSGSDITLQKKHSAKLDLLAEREREHAQRLRKLHDLVHSFLHAQTRGQLLKETMGYLESTIPGSSCSAYLFIAGRKTLDLPKLERLAGYGEESVSEPGPQVMTSVLTNSPFVEYNEHGAETRRISPIFFQHRSVGAVEIRKPSGMSSSELGIYRLMIDYVSGFWTLYDILAQREEEASIDPLTGIWNRRYMIRRLQEESDRIARYGGNACLAIGDMGNFKHINDTHGHTKGDEVLIKAAVVMRDNLRASDNVGRYGGDEFLLLLPNITEEAAAAVVSRIQDGLSRMEIASDDSDPDSPPVPVVMDFGMTFYPNGVPSLVDAIALADEDMFAHKAARKDRLRKELLEKSDPGLEAALKERP